MYSTADLQIRGSTIHGLGVFAVRAIPRRTRVLQYMGKRLTREEAEAIRDKTYCFKVDNDYTIDGLATWNPAGFINHSCKPNCESWVFDGTIWIVASRDIAPGEELTFNYGYPLEGLRQHPCHCGAPNCVGYMVAEKFFSTVQQMRENGELSK
jgi:SET domain-containing protein